MPLPRAWRYMCPLATEDMAWNSYFSMRYGGRMPFTKHRLLPRLVMFDMIAVEISQSPHTSEDGTSENIIHCLVCLETFPINPGSLLPTCYLLLLKGAIKYEQDELPACKSLVDQCLSDDPDTVISYASISFKDQGTLYLFIMHFRCLGASRPQTSKCRSRSPPRTGRH